MAEKDEKDNLKKVDEFIENSRKELNNENDEAIFNRDKEILYHIQHRYEEEERRFETVDSKISSMIAVLAMIFTIQSSLFTNILVLHISIENMRFKHYKIFVEILI